MSNTEILSDLLVHLPSDSVELNRLGDDAADISQSLDSFLGNVAFLDLCGDSVYAFDHVYHIFKGVLDVLLEVILIGVKGHVLLPETNVEQARLPLLLHLIQQMPHGLVIHTHKSLDHHEVNQLNKVTQSLLVSIGNFK